MGSGFDADCGGFADMSHTGNYPIIGWFWDFGNGTTSNLQNPVNICYDSSGNFSVCLIVVDAGGISSQKCKTNYMIRDPSGTHCNYFVGIPETSIREFYCFPNPAQETITFISPDGMNGSLVIYNTALSVVYDHAFSKMAVINSSVLTKGIYFYRLTGENGKVYTGKFIKQ
jgi:PKD repeat protein